MQNRYHCGRVPGECAKATTVYSRRIENLKWWSDHNKWYTQSKGSTKIKRLLAKTLIISIGLGEKAVKV